MVEESRVPCPACGEPLRVEAGKGFVCDNPNCPDTLEEKYIEEISKERGFTAEISDLEIAPTTYTIGELGMYLLKENIMYKRGWAYCDFNDIQDRDKALGTFIRRKCLSMNYQTRAEYSDKRYIDFRFKEAPESALVITEVLAQSRPVLDLLIIPPSERGKVTLPTDEDCYFIEVKTTTSINEHGPTFSPRQLEYFARIKDSINLLIAQVSLSLDGKLNLVPVDDFIREGEYIHPWCGKTFYVEKGEFDFIGGMNARTCCIEVCPDDPNSCEIASKYWGDYEAG